MAGLFISFSLVPENRINTSGEFHYTGKLSKKRDNYSFSAPIVGLRQQYHPSSLFGEFEALGKDSREVENYNLLYELARQSKC